MMKSFVLLAFACVASQAAMQVELPRGAGVVELSRDSSVKPVGDVGAVGDTLMELFDATNGTHWTNSTGWGKADDWCTWFGVNCDGGSKVAPIGLVLNNNNLVGTLPVSLPKLQDLQALLMHDNQINGELPSDIGTIPYIQVFWMSNNKLSGAVPASLGKIRHLSYMYLEQNEFTSVACEQPGGGKLNANTCDMSGNPLTCPIADWVGDPCQGKCRSQ